MLGNSTTLDSLYWLHSIHFAYKGKKLVNSSKENWIPQSHSHYSCCFGMCAGANRKAGNTYLVCCHAWQILAWIDVVCWDPVGWHDDKRCIYRHCLSICISRGQQVTITAVAAQGAVATHSSLARLASSAQFTIWRVFHGRRQWRAVLFARQKCAFAAAQFATSKRCLGVVSSASLFSRRW